MKKSLKFLSLFAVACGLFMGGMPKSDTPVVAEAAPKTHRRIFVVLKGDWSVQQMYIHYWGGSSGSDWHNCPKMNLALDDYYEGLFYYDVPYDTKTFLVKNERGEIPKPSNQSANMNVSQLFLTNDYKVAWVEAWKDDPVNREINAGDLSMGEAQFEGMLRHYNTCSDSSTNGYNAYPQLKGAILDHSDASIRNSSKLVEEPNGNRPTIKEKLDYMKQMYEIHGSVGATLASKNNEVSTTLLTVALSSVGIITFAGYYLSNRKKLVA